MTRQDWQDPQVAFHWDAYHPFKYQDNPIRPEQLDIVLSIIRDHYQSGQTILDLGIGNGFVEEMLFQRIPDAQIIGIDYSSAMIEHAHKRLASYRAQYKIIQHDLAQMETVTLPPAAYQIAISIQTLHHLSTDEMQATYRFIYQTLATGGLFILMDRIQVDQPELWSVYRSLWRRQGQVYQADTINSEGATLRQHQRWLEERGDYPQPALQIVDALRKEGFAAQIMHLHANRAVFVARK